MEKPFGFYEKHLDNKENPLYQEFLESYLKKELQLPFKESEGFLLIPAENVLITPYQKEIGSGLVEIKEPIQKSGTEKFSKRDEYEKNFPRQLLKPSIELENLIFAGKETPEKSFHPNFDIRFCINLIKIFENAEDAYILMPILPASGQKYEKQLKLPGSNLLRGSSFPQHNQVLNTAANKANLKAKIDFDKKEKILSQEQFLKTGLWTIQFTNSKGKYSRIYNCHLWRDEDTGTLDAFIMKKQFVFQDIDDFDCEDTLSGEINRAHALVSLNELLGIEEGETLNLKHLYQGNQRITNLQELSADYTDMFSMDAWHNFTLKESKFTPALRAFLDYEKMILKKENPEIESLSSQNQELLKEAKIKIGELFEKLMSKILGLARNEENQTYRLDQINDQKKISDEYPSDFKNWAKRYIAEHHALVIKPDFISSNGDFIEVKRGKALNSDDNKNQIYRMLLYKILSGANINLQVISLHPLVDQPILDGVEYRYFFDSTYTNNLEKADLAEIYKWEEKIAKLEK